MKLRYIGTSTVRDISSNDLFAAFGLEAAEAVHVDKRVSDQIDVSAAVAAVLLSKMPDEFAPPRAVSAFTEPDRDEEGNMVPGTGTGTDIATTAVDPERKTEDDTSLPSGDNHDETGTATAGAVDSDPTKTTAESATSQPKSPRRS